MCMVEMAIFNIQKSNNSKSRKTIVMVHVFCMSSHGVKHLCQVS